jgi:hypothetical protein
VSPHERWLSRRALLLHLALLAWFPGCLVAFFWQVHRAFNGNGLSYVYSIEWPVFALAGLWGWWQLVHTDPGTVGRRAQERMAAATAMVEGAGAAGGASDATRPAAPVRRRGDEDPELAAYNDRLARLAAEGPKGWRRR